MPTVLRIGRFRFHFFSDEGHEPHTSTCELLMASCKFWLEPAIMLANNKGVPAHELRRIEELVFENQEILKNAYDDRHPR